VSDNLSRDEFFIGWLQTPSGYVRFLKPVVLAFVVIVLVAAVALAFLQSHPGDAEWNDEKVVTLRGMVFTSPYAMLRVTGEGQDDPARTYLLVEDGKFGAFPRVSRLTGGQVEGTAVEAKGTILHRGDRWMVALEEGDTGMRLLTASETRALPAIPETQNTNSDEVVLRGEIVDSKCYLGAMKPGGGKTHKACAMRCIAGGIPPMLVTHDASGRETFYLLVAPDGGVANGLVHAFVGDRVLLRGHVEQRDDILVLHLSDDSVERQ
jgi:hypothetical protein